MTSFVRDLPYPAALVVADIKRTIRRQRKASRPRARAARTRHRAGESLGEHLEVHRRNSVPERNERDRISLLGKRRAMGRSVEGHEGAVAILLRHPGVA